MKILVCGGRDYNDYAKVESALDALMHLTGTDGDVIVVHGGATGADTLAGKWASSKGFLQKVYTPEWDDISSPGALVKYNKYGKPYNALAGPVRNQRMLDENPDISYVVAFPGGKGTSDMVKRAEKKGINIIKI